MSINDETPSSAFRVQWEKLQSSMFLLFTRPALFLETLKSPAPTILLLVRTVFLCFYYFPLLRPKDRILIKNRITRLTRAYTQFKHIYTYTHAYDYAWNRTYCGVVQSDGRMRVRCSGGMRKAKTVTLLLLPLACLVILEPIEHILAFDLAILSKLSRDLLYLLSVGSPHASSVQHFQYPNLLLRGIPPRPPWMRFHLQ